MIEVVFFAVAGLAALYILLPAFRKSALREVDPRTSLELARETSLRAIRDLELDWATGKVSEDDYRDLRATQEAEAADIMRRLAALERQT
jgi:hypothetical protein